MTSRAIVLAVAAIPQLIDVQKLPADRPDRPNIVLIMADDLGYAELGCYGQQKIRTPNIDRIAADGMRFTNSYTSAPVCAPARCSLMTGRHGGHAEVRNNFEVKTPDEEFGGQHPISDSEVTIAEMLKAKGYATGAFGKWGLGRVGSSGDPLKQGFDRFFGYNCQGHAHNYYPRYLVDDSEKRTLAGNDRGLTGRQYAPQLIADELIRFVRSNASKPFFAYYPSVIPHLALQIPEKNLKEYEGQWDETPYTGRSYLPHPRPRSAYAAMISFLDRQVGRLMTTLQELGIEDNTVVIFTSDNGTTYLEGQVDFDYFESVGPLRGLKGSMYEGGIRVPLIVRWPGHIDAGTVSNRPCVHYDIMATIARIVGVDAPPGTDGVSYLPTLLGKSSEQIPHDYLFWDFAGYGGQLSVRQGDWKGLKLGVTKNPAAPLELYNLRDDISESKNVAADHPEIVQRMESIMLEARTPPDFVRFRFGRYE